MKEALREVSSSEFLLPELTAIGDAVSQVLQLGADEELLGESIMARVQPLIAQGRVTSSDVVRVALLTDALRVAEEAIIADDAISDAELGYALPLVSAAAKRLGTFRAFYADMHDATAEHVREFIETHRPDTQLFGGACTDTRWLGLEIVSRVAEESGDRDPLDRYCELMVRLAEEIVALGGKRIPRDEVRAALEARVGIRKLLAAAQQSAPEESEDPRVRVFCSPDAPEVFHAVAHASQIWRRDPFDVELVHEETRMLFSRLLDRAAAQDEAGTGRVLLVLGEAGSGKTHLMRAFRERTHGLRSGYVGYMQMSAASDDYARYVLVNLIESLEKPFDEPGVQESGLMCLSDALLMAPVSVTPEDRTKLRDGDMSEDNLCSLVFRLADEVVRDTRFSELDIDLVRAFLFLQRREPPIYKRVIKYLRCEPMGRRDLAMLGELTPKTQSDDPLRVLTHLGKLIASVQGGALVLLLDQLEDIYAQERAKERFTRLMDVVRHLGDHIPNVLIVVSCLRDFYKEMRSGLTKSVLDRVEQDPQPQNLLVDRSLSEIEAIAERRLQYLFEHQGVRHRADQPTFPYERSTLERLARLSARDVLRELHEVQRRAIALGRLPERDVDPVLPQPSIPPPPPALTHLWSEFRAAESAKVDVPDDDAALLALLQSALESAALELPIGVGMSLRKQGEALHIESPDRGEGPTSLIVCFTNKSTRGGGLSRQLDELLKASASAKRTPIALRCSEFGSGPTSTVTKHLGNLVRNGGRKVVVDDGAWRTLLAYRAFRAQHGGQVGFGNWARDERPMLTVEVIRTVLGLPALGAGSVDTFVLPGAAKAPSVRPPAVRKGASAVDLTPVNPASVVVPRRKPSNDGPFQIGVTISVQAQPATLDPRQLARHAAFLGASGSGKTSLALNVIEQLIARQVGAILIDRKGDLAVYADPALRHSEDPDPRRAQLKRELFERAHVRLFTPGNPTGRPMRIRAVPSDTASLPPHERAQVAQFAAQGLGAMMGYRGTSTDNTNLAILAKAVEVIGQLAGNGEVRLRQLIDLLAEEDPYLISQIGHLDPKLFKRLVTHLETLRINHAALLESNDEPLRAETLLGRDGSVPDGRVPLTIISTKFLGGAERVDFWISQMLVELSRWSSRSPAKHLQSVLFLDEADIYMPATSKPATKEPLLDLLKRARSAGLGVMLATQNPGDLDYKCRDNIGTWWIGRVGSRTAIDKMKPLLSECRTDVSGALATASVGEFFQVCDGTVVRMRSERALMDTVQLPEDRILGLARGGGEDDHGRGATEGSLNLSIRSRFSLSK